MPQSVAIEMALKEFGCVAPYVTAARSGTEFAQGKFRVQFFNRTFLISHPEGHIEPADGKGPYPGWLHLVILHYLLGADGRAVADEWITYRQLPGATFFETRFVNMASAPLTRRFGGDIEGFRRAGLALGGEPISRTGDAGFRFLALPRIPMACVLYLGDEEVQPSVSVFFDASASAYLPTEDLSLVGSYLNAMQRLAGKA